MDARCKTCQAQFTRVDNKLRHEKSCDEMGCYPCAYCGERFSRGDNITRHMKHIHNLRDVASQTRDILKKGEVDNNTSRISTPNSLVDQLRSYISIGYDIAQPECRNIITTLKSHGIIT